MPAGFIAPKNRIVGTIAIPAGRKELLRRVDDLADQVVARVERPERAVRSVAIGPDDTNMCGQVSAEIGGIEGEGHAARPAPREDAMSEVDTLDRIDCWSRPNHSSASQCHAGRSHRTSLERIQMEVRERQAVEGTVGDSEIGKNGADHSRLGARGTNYCADQQSR
jgi:hypothetical protein